MSVFLLGGVLISTLLGQLKKPKDSGERKRSLDQGLWSQKMLSGQAWGFNGSLYVLSGLAAPP